MEAFLPWLYARYIYPYQEERVLGSGYELDLSLMDSNLTPEERVNFNKSREFFSLQASVSRRAFSPAGRSESARHQGFGLWPNRLLWGATAAECQFSIRFRYCPV